MTQPKCPETQSLQSFVRFKLTEEEFNSILEHLGSCRTCDETVCNLEKQSETIADRIRRLPPIPYSEEPEYQQLLAKIKSGELSTAGRTREECTLVDPPRVVRDYELLELLGQGGMGHVHRAVHQRLKRTVAIKLLTTGRLKDQSAVARFEREMSLLGRLDHPNIVRAQDAGEHDGQHYLVMEYVDGVDLGVLVNREGRLPIPEACSVIQQAAVALQYAHERGCVHRDIKPSNLMLAKTDQRAMVKVLDLGLARALESDSDHSPPVTELTSANQIMGTLDYMAPEQGDDSHVVDIRADIYSLGATLYKLLTGEAPHAAHAGKPIMQRLMAIAKAEVAPLQTKRPDVPVALASIVHRMLAKQPEDRFASPAEVAQALEPFASGADLAQLLSPKSDTAVLAHEITAVLETSKKTPPPRRRSRWTMGFFGAVGIALLGVILSITTKHGTVTVESPDGKLPQDLKVIIKDGGENIAILQAENNWTVRLVNGVYQTEIQGGQDQLEIEDATLRVQRMGRAEVTVKWKPNAAGQVTAKPVVASPPPSVSSPRVELPVDPAKPFVVVRQGKFQRAFQSLAAAVDELQANDWIEVTSNARLTIQPSEPITKPLHILGAAGFRPTLYFAQRDQHHLLNVVQIEDCELDLRDLPFRSHGHGLVPHHWQFHRCRIWGALSSSPRQLTVTDSIICSPYAFVASYHDEAQYTFQNCAIRSIRSLVQIGRGQISLTLEHCSFYMNEWGHPVIAKVDDGQLQVDAADCLFYLGSGQRSILLQEDFGNIQWRGRRNLFVGPGPWGSDQPKAAEPATSTQGLADWNRLWAEPEVDSRQIEALCFEWGRLNRLTGTDRIQAIRQTLERAAQRQSLPDAGPDWDIIGSGDAYVRALEKSGRIFKPEELRPERPQQGAFLLLRKGTLIQPHQLLQTAVDEAQDGDEIEIRSDNTLPGLFLHGSDRLLTIRSAPGYQPVVEWIVTNGTDHLILEGITLKSGLQASGACGIPDPAYQFFERTGSIRRLLNCTVESAIGGLFNPMNEQPPEIINCQLHEVTAGIQSGGEFRISNSLIRELSILTASDHDQPARLEFNRSAIFCPEAVPGGFYAESLFCHRRVTISANSSLFFPRRDLVRGNDITNITWTGNKNIFCKTGGTLHSSMDYETLSRHQAACSSDQDSVELPPYEFDPAQWRIDRIASPGYEPKPDGTDYGVDVDSLHKAINGEHLGDQKMNP